MFTTIVGFPRIGKNREWKKSLENYWSGKISEETLLQEAQNLQNNHIQAMQNLDEIPLDFFLYDHMLETAFLLGAIPETVAHTSLSLYQKYFALARGYKDNLYDIKAWPMKKWFFTNYHYIVPQITPETTWKGDTSFLSQKFLLAHTLSKLSRLTIPGPYTFWKLSKTIDVSTEKVINHLQNAYLNLLSSTPSSITWQFDEPALVLDITDQEKEIFQYFYHSLSSFGERIHLQTYFGDIEDIYEEVISLPFRSIGLDFIDGRKNLSLLQKYGFPQNKKLYAGIVSGRNVWKTRYSETLTILSTLLQSLSQKNLVLSTSCSLLHVPYTTKDENFPPEVSSVICFGLEKIQELNEISLLSSLSDPFSHPYYEANTVAWEIFSKLPRDNRLSISLQKISKNDFHRSLPVEKRLPLQRKKLNLPLLPTTTIGSFPQTPQLRQLRKTYQEGQMTASEYEKHIKSMIQKCIKQQEDIGLDVLVHGEYERNDMVEYFASFLSGFLTTKNGWVQSYGSRVTKPPIIYHDIKRLAPMTVPWITYAQSLTQKPVKAILTGPITLINWSFCREDVSLQEIAYQIALSLREEIEELQEKGISIIQVDEAALREKLPLKKRDWNSYLEIAISAFRLATSHIKPDVQLHTHMCYSEFSDIAEAIEKLDADVLSIEASKSDFSVLESLRHYSQKREIGPGVYDIHSPRIPPKEEIETIIQKLLQIIPPHNLWINPDCGLKTRKEAEAFQSLKHMVEAVHTIRTSLY